MMLNIVGGLITTWFILVPAGYVLWQHIKVYARGWWK